MPGTLLATMLSTEQYPQATKKRRQWEHAIHMIWILEDDATPQWTDQIPG